MPLQGESFLQAEARRKREDRERASNPEGKGWAAPRSIFVPPAFTKAPPKPPPKPKMAMPGTRFKEPKPTRKQEREGMIRSAEERRDFSLGLTKRKQAPNISDAVETGDEIKRRKAQPKIDKLADPPFQIRADPQALLRWKRGRIQALDISPADKRGLLADARDEHALLTRAPDPFAPLAPVGRAALGQLRNAMSYVEPATAFTPRGGQFGPTKTGRQEVTQAQARARAETALEAGLGKAPANLLTHFDLPGTWGEAGGLAAGVLTIGPGGKVLRAGGMAGKLAFDAVKAEEGIKAALAAGKAGYMAGYTGPSNTAKIIQWGRAARGNRLGARQVEDIRQNAGMLVALRRSLVEAGDHDAAAQVEQTLARADIGPHGEFHGWSREVTDKRVASKLNEKNRAKGIPYKNGVVESKTAPGIVVAGPVSNEQWFAKMIAAFPTSGERQQWAQWYEEFAPAFREMFGPQAEELMRGFSVSQANQSPTGGLLATLRVLDRLQAGDTPASIGHKGIATKSLVKTIAKAVEGEDGKVDKGVAAKLSDFIDSFLKKDTRTFMGDHEHGGKPSAIDVHAMRDLGLIDEKLAAKLEAVHGLKRVSKEEFAKRGLREGEFVVDSQGRATGPLYERLSERYEEIAQYLNEMRNADGSVGFDGRSNWEPREVQALGWGATQKTHGVDPENLGSAFGANTRTFNLEMGADLTEEEARRVAQEMAPFVQRVINETGQAYRVTDVQVGAAGTAGAASLHFSVMSSPEVAESIANRLARVFDRHDVWAYKVGGNKSKRHMRIQGVPDGETAAAIYASLRSQDKKLFKNGFTFVDGEMVLKMPGKNITLAEQEAFRTSMDPFVAKAEQELNLPSLDYDGANLQIIKGDSSAKLQGSGGGKRGVALEHPGDAKARAAYEAAVGRAAESSRIRRAAGRVSQAVGPQPMGIVPPGTVGPGFQRAMEAAKDLPALPSAPSLVAARNELKAAEENLAFWRGQPVSAEQMANYEAAVKRARENVARAEGNARPAVVPPPPARRFANEAGAKLDFEVRPVTRRMAERLPSDDYTDPLEAVGGVMVTAKRDGRKVGHIIVRPDGVIHDADVSEEFRRQGIATAMLRHLRGQGHDVLHAEDMTPEGEAWAASTMGEDTPLGKTTPERHHGAVPPPPARSARFVSEAVERTPLQVSQRIVQLDSELDPIIYDLARGMKQQGMGKAMSTSLARTGKPKYFNTYGDYQSAKIAEYDKRVARFKKTNPGQKYEGAHFTDPWPEWGEDLDTFDWKDADTYAIGKDAEIEVEQNMAWYREQAEAQLTKQLAAIAAKGGEDGSRARRLLIKFQERDSLKGLEAKNKGALLFPEDVPASGYGQDLRVVAKHPTAAERPAAPLRPRATGGTPPPPPVRPVARQLPSPEFDKDFLDKVRKQVIDALPSAEKRYVEQEALRAPERKKRVTEALHIMEMGEGGPGGLLAARLEARKALAGAMPKLEWREFEFLDQDAADALMAHALHHPELRDWEKIRTFWAIDRGMKKGVITPSEVKLLRKAFGDKVAENLGNRENMSTLQWLWQLGIDIWNSPRSLMASYDLSAPFRQGLVSGADHPILFMRNLVPMTKAFMHEETHLAHMDEIAGRFNFPTYEKMKLAITDVHGSGAGREEAFPESLVERIPGVNFGIKRSARSYSLFLSKQRADVADRLLGLAGGEAKGGLLGKFRAGGQDVESKEFLEALGEFINTTTGRGKIPTKYGEDAATFLNQFLFSPRLLASRLQILNPNYYRRMYKADPWLARQALQASTKTISGIALSSYLLSQIPGVHVSWNPTSSDFGKVRIGNTRIDLAGGFQPLIVFYAREVLGRTTVASTGVTRPLGGFGGRDRYEVAERFIAGKYAPGVGLIRDFASDMKTYVGDPVTLKGEAWNLGIPLNVQGAYEALRKDGYSMGAAALALGSIGFGTSSFKPKVPSGGGGFGGGTLPTPGGDGGGGILPTPGSDSGTGILPTP